MTSQKHFYGNYLGIVVQNNDPLKRGRVKIFVPHISPTVYKGWNEISKDKKFKFVGANTYSDLTSILEDLKQILPWAECAAPLVGESSSGRYSKNKNAGSISDSNKLQSFVTNLSSAEINSQELTQFSQNYDNIGEKPANIFEKYAYKLQDAFADPKETNINIVNKFAFNYTPESYSNSAKGAFAIPSVGSHLWAFFSNGNPMKPVYFATSFGQSDWSSIYSASSAVYLDGNTVPGAGIDYPGEFENNSNDYSNNTETYRNKYVINQKGGTLSFVNTDNRETLKLTHYSGSFKEFNNFTNIELATKNDQKMVLEDSFLTVKGNRNEFTRLDHDVVVQGNFYKKIGTLKKDLAEQWKKIVTELNDIKQLFDIQRANRVTNQILKYTSTKQELNGRRAPCPVCNSNKDTYVTYNNTYGIGSQFAGGFLNKIIAPMADESGDYNYSQTISILGIVPSILFPGVMGNPIITSAIGSLDGGIGGGASNGPGKIFGDTCPACGGSGESPSSQDGFWKAENKIQKIQGFFDKNLKKLADIEEQLGLGGSEIVEITKHKIETIGTVMNDFGSIRLDDSGKMEISEVKIAQYGAFYNRTPTPVIEYVNVDDLPGGNYTLNVCNRYSVLVGAGGLNLKSFGPVNLGGTITNISGDQLNLASGNEVNIDGGKRLSIVADIISIRQRIKKQVLIDSSLGISKNLIVAGGGYFDGELFVQHITAPVEYQETEGKVIWASAATDPTNMLGKIIGYGVPISNFAVPGGIGGGYLPLPATLPFGPPYLGFTDVTTTAGLIDPTVLSILAANIVAPPAGGPCTYVPAAAYVGTSTIPYAGPALPVNGAGPTYMCVKGSDQGIGGANASTMPIVVYGTGRDPSSIFIPEHKHMFKNIPLTLKETNKEVREAAKSLEKGQAVGPSPIVNAHK